MGGVDFCCPKFWMHFRICDFFHTIPNRKFFSPMAQQPLVGQGLLIIQASRSRSHTPHSVGFLWTNDLPDAETST